MTLEAIGIDLILAVIIGLFVYLSARRGGVRTIIEAIGFIAAAALAFTVCTPLASITYDKIIEPPILTVVSNEVDEDFKEVLYQIPDLEDDSDKLSEYKDKINGSINDIIERLPPYIKNFTDKTDLNADEILKGLEAVTEKNDTVANMANKLAKNISQNKIKPLAVPIISYIYSFIIFSVALILVKILARLINKALSFSIAGKLNKALGGVCGLVKGVVLALVFCVIVYAVISVTNEALWIFSIDNIEKTLIFKLLIGLIKI